MCKASHCYKVMLYASTHINKTLEIANLKELHCTLVMKQLSLLQNM